MDIRRLRYEDYDTIVEWWKFWRFPAPSAELLPSLNETEFSGIIASEGGKDIAVGFLYLTNSGISWIEFVVTNPKTTNKERHDGIISVLEYLSNEAKSNGYKYIFSSIKNENLINKYKESGFIEGSTGTTEFIKIL